MLGDRGVGLDLGPQAPDVHVDQPPVAEIVVTPDPVEQLLAASPNKVLSREQLLDRVWGYDYFGDGRLVDVHIRRLRTKVEADPAVPQHILTVRGMGYKLVP